MSEHQLTLADLAQKRVMLKKAEDEAIAARRAIDELISSQLAKAGTTEGTVTEKLDGFKVSVSYGVTRKLDTKKLQADWEKIPARVRECINWKADLSTSGFRTLDNESVKALSDYMETKPATPTVKVEIVA
jgi:predicted NUDIX family NTP pyrophosphohydrolase